MQNSSDKGDSEHLQVISKLLQTLNEIIEVAPHILTEDKSFDLATRSMERVVESDRAVLLDCDTQTDRLTQVNKETNTKAQNDLKLDNGIIDIFIEPRPKS